ncbi:ADP-ribose pyrophosphatase [Thermoplasmatales archaeon BRNA1]|nr:ADP-ribose pyrophosphatase [Thermoplasmatales archaeon BRNA1]
MTDTDDTVYTVAFQGERFLMVYNEKRKGWEMPGGHVREGESREDAAKREFLEESGYDIEIVEIRDLGPCRVCAALLKDRINPRPEMVAKLFCEVPDEIFFSREEYEDVVPWAWNALRG